MKNNKVAVTTGSFQLYNKNNLSLFLPIISLPIILRRKCCLVRQDATGLAMKIFFTSLGAITID